MSGTLTVGGEAAGLLSGQNVIGPATMVGTTVIGERLDVVLASGDNTLTVPQGTGITVTAVLIVLPASSTVELKIRTNLNSGDAGLPVGPTGFVVWAVYTGTTSIIINAASAAGAIEATFI